MNSHSADWFDLFSTIKYKRQAHPEEVTVAKLTSCTNKKEIIMNTGEGGKYILNMSHL